MLRQAEPSLWKPCTLISPQGPFEAKRQNGERSSTSTGIWWSLFVFKHPLGGHTTWICVYSSMMEKFLQNHALRLAVLILMPWSWKCMLATGQCIRLKDQVLLSMSTIATARHAFNRQRSFESRGRTQRLTGRQNLLGRLWSGASSKSRLQGEWLPCHVTCLVQLNDISSASSCYIQC